MDLLMERMKQAGIQFGDIAAISGAGQQHGSVYCLDPTLTLKEQLSPKAFSIQRAPIWQDSSTTQDCQALEEAIGGPQVLADLSGSRAYERFTGTQIAKIRRLDPEAYAATSRISLVSSFIPSLFLGHIAPIEVSDASGMNLMDVLTCKWDDRLLTRFQAGRPSAKSAMGDCIIAPFTAVHDSHLLAHPTTLDAQIAMLCYKNGALAREQVRDRYCERDWQRFNQAVEGSPAGNNGHVGLYFPLPEIIPPNIVGSFFYKGIPAEAHPRAILESQFLSIRSRIAAILPPHAPHLHRLVVTGGSSANETIRQLAADLFGMKVYVSQTKEAAGMGGALLAKYVWWRAARGGTGL
ncbi:hypothetical protein K438DRAFT_1817249 [Mycena galopus ATCC 62051]|nr:hypothetical protein K438DRAFT_1817249 [Mycena galopus ATCC 62051]